MKRPAFKLFTNRKNDCGCGASSGCECDAITLVKLTVNFSNGVRRQQYEGREHLIAPLVMLRETVVNGAFVPADELMAASWNGVPVTVGHPKNGESYTTANTPDTRSEWAIGTIFNARVQDGKLKAEAWIDIQRAEKIAPGLVAQIESGNPMDVSTGYFATGEAAKGVYNGKTYETVHRNLKPDHLALLPNEEGACNWQDGCGVRVNKGKKDMDKDGILNALAKALGIETNARGSDDDTRQMIADLIASDDSPFLPDDMYGLMEMKTDTLKGLRDTYLPKANKGKKDMSEKTTDGDKPTVNASVFEAQGFDAETAKRMADAANAAAAPKANADDAAANKADEDAKAAAKDEPTGNTALSDQDREDLAWLRSQRAAERETLVQRITSNSAMTADALKAMTLEQLTVIANGLKPAPNYAGRAMPSPTVNKDDTAAAEMAQNGVVSHINAKRKAAASA